jgi:phosphate transport system permease protein
VEGDPVQVCTRGALAGIVTGVLLAVARISRRDGAAAVHRAVQPVLELDLNKPMANLPVTIFKFAP